MPSSCAQPAARARRDANSYDALTLRDYLFSRGPRPGVAALAIPEISTPFSKLLAAASTVASTTVALVGEANRADYAKPRLVIAQLD
ncbi:MAG: hypothetical protein ACRETH_10335, partial [Steroidobacteraceae bacterium]